jgi:hypothetical protein
MIGTGGVAGSFVPTGLPWVRTRAYSREWR